MRLGHVSQDQAKDDEFIKNFARTRMQMSGMNPADYRVIVDELTGEVNAVLKPEATDIEVKRG